MFIVPWPSLPARASPAVTHPLDLRTSLTPPRTELPSHANPQRPSHSASEHLLGPSQQDLARSVHQDHPTRHNKWTTRLSKLKSKLSSHLQHQRQGRGDIGDYTGFKIYEEEQRERQRRKISSSTTGTIGTTGTTNTDVTLVESVGTSSTRSLYEERLNVDDNENEDNVTGKQGNRAMATSRRKLSNISSKSVPMSTSASRWTRNQQHQEIPEAQDEHNARKSAKAERRRERWIRWYGGVDVEMKIDTDHDGESCGWWCAEHRRLRDQGWGDYWAVAGMYM